MNGALLPPLPVYLPPLVEAGGLAGGQTPVGAARPARIVLSASTGEQMSTFTHLLSASLRQKTLSISDCCWMLQVERLHYPHDHSFPVWSEHGTFVTSHGGKCSNVHTLEQQCREEAVTLQSYDTRHPVQAQITEVKGRNIDVLKVYNVNVKHLEQMTKDTVRIYSHVFYYVIQHSVTARRLESVLNVYGCL